MLSGKWTFRSFRNETRLLGVDPAAIRGLILMEGVLDLESDGEGRFHGALGLSDGTAIAVAGRLDEIRASLTIRMEGVSGAEGKIPSQEGTGAFVPAASAAGPDLIVGTLRGSDAAKRGFIGIRHPHNPPQRTARRSLLTAGL
jgi:hypothetical protein